MQVIAHRGASAHHPENSIAAFAAAVTVGADGVELDVRSTVDGRLAVHHDPRLPDGRRITALRAAELPPVVPLLEQAIDACRDLHVNVEIKVDAERRGAGGDVATAERVLSVMSGRGPDAYSISSFDLATIDAVSRLDPAAHTAHLFDRGDPAECLRRLVRAGHRVAHPHDLMVDEVFMAVALDLEVRVNVWTVDDPRRLVDLENLGVDGVITNDPKRALQVLTPPR